MNAFSTSTPLARAVLLVGGAGCAIALGNLFMRQKEYDLQLRKDGLAMAQYLQEMEQSSEDIDADWKTEMDVAQAFVDNLRHATERRVWKSARYLPDKLFKVFGLSFARLGRFCWLGRRNNTCSINGLSNFRQQVKRIFLGFNVRRIAVVKPGYKTFPRNVVFWMFGRHNESSFVGGGKSTMDVAGSADNGTASLAGMCGWENRV